MVQEVKKYSFKWNVLFKKIVDGVLFLSKWGHFTVACQLLSSQHSTLISVLTSS